MPARYPAASFTSAAGASVSCISRMSRSISDTACAVLSLWMADEMVNVPGSRRIPNAELAPYV